MHLKKKQKKSQERGRGRGLQEGSKWVKYPLVITEELNLQYH